MKNLTLLIVLILISLFAFPASAQQDWQLVSVQELEELGLDTARWAALSPDATKLAGWSEQVGLCIYDFETQTTNCAEMPEDLGRISALVWSPDGQFIAMHVDPFRFLYESDLWIVDVATSQLTNMTDDQVAPGDYMEAMNVDTPFTVDFLPRWVDNTLYFLRIDRAANHVGLYRLTINETALAEGQEPELVADLSPHVDNPLFSVYALIEFPLEGFMAISPDGTRAAIVAHPEHAQGLAVENVLLVDLASGAVTELVAGADLLSIGRNDDLFPLSVIINGLGWADNSTLVLTTTNLERAYSPAPTYQINTDSGEVIPLMDLSHVESAEDSLEPIGSSGVAYGTPLTSLLTPDGSALLVASYQDEPIVYAIPVAGGEPIQLAELGDEQNFSLQSFNGAGITPDGIMRVLIGNVLFTFES